MEITLYTPHKNQEKIHQSILNDPYKYYVLNIGRQFGKSLLAINQILFWGIKRPNSKIAWISPIYKQAKKVFDDIDSAIYKTPICAERNKADLNFKLLTGSTIQFFSAERYDNIRGFTFDYLVCDEFAFIDEKAWTEVLRATVLVHGKKVLLISTPKGKNHFYQLHQLDGINPQYKSFKMTSYDNPIIKPSEIDDARITLPDHVFRQEYLAEFIDGGASLFPDLTINDQPEKTGRYFAGIDVGRAEDYTVLTIFNDKGQMVLCERWRQMQWSSIVKLVAEVLKDYRPETYVEINSVGDAVYEMLQDELKGIIYIEPFMTTSKSKQDMIEQMMVANQNKEFTILSNPEIKKEFNLFTYEYNPKTRNVKYSAPSGFHDDIVMSTAIAFQSYKINKIKGVGFTLR